MTITKVTIHSQSFGSAHLFFNRLPSREELKRALVDTFFGGVLESDGAQRAYRAYVEKIDEGAYCTDECNVTQL